MGDLLRRIDVFIVGGGPAGLAAAIAARQKGFEVIVADGSAPPIEKACGEGMMPGSLEALRAMGVRIGPMEGQPFSGIAFIQESTPMATREGVRVAADFPQGPGVGLRRPFLHERMTERAEECGVRFLWKTPVVGLDDDGVRTACGKFSARWIVGADGLGSRVRSWSGLDAGLSRGQRFASRRHYRVQPWSKYMEVYWGFDTQAYVTPIGREEVCVAMLADSSEETSFDRALGEFPKLRERLAGVELSSRERGAVTAIRSLDRVQRRNVALVGDASGSVDAITGEGLWLAFRQASALAHAMIDGDLRVYQRAHRTLSRRPLLIGNLMVWMGRNPRIRSRVFRALQSRPELFARLLAAHLGVADPGEILSAGALLGWRLLNV